jgi:hypothetical protein
MRSWRACGLEDHAPIPPGKRTNSLCSAAGPVFSNAITFMESVTLGTSSIVASRISYGCWRIAGAWDRTDVTPDREATGRRAVTTAYESGITLFDNADVYCGGEGERIFGQALRKYRGCESEW